MLDALTHLVRHRVDAAGRARDAQVETVKAEILRLEGEARHLVRFLPGGESVTVRDELTTIESALQGLRVELANLRAARPDPPVVSRAWIERRVDELIALVAQNPVRARLEIRKHLDGDLELRPVSALVRGDLAEPSEMEALKSLQAQAPLAKLEIVTSRESWREQERTRSPETREELRNARPSVQVVSHDHRVLGFNTIDYGHGGFIASPLVTDIVDEALFATLRKLSLKDADARHLMYAASNGCVRFVTTDPDFIKGRQAIHTVCPTIRIVKPSELLGEIEHGGDHLPSCISGRASALRAPASPRPP